MPKTSKRTGDARKSAELKPGATWDKESKVDEYDGRARMREPGEGDPSSGKWNTAKPKAVVVSKYRVRNPGENG